MRKAVYYAINHAAVAAAGGNSVALTSYGVPGGNGYVELEGESFMNTYDPAKAMELMQEAGYNGHEITLIFSNAEYETNCATMIQALLTNVGLNVKLKPADSIAIFDVATDPTEYDLYFAYRGGSNVITGLNKMCNWNEFGTGESIGFVHDEKLQELFEAARTLATYGPESATALEEYIIEQGYFIDVCAQVNFAAYRDTMTAMHVYNNKIFADMCVYNVQ